VKDVAVAQARPLQANPENYKIGRLLFSRIWRLARPYWVRHGALGSWILLITLTLVAPGMSLLSAYNSVVLKNMTDAIVARHVPAYWSLLALFVGLQLVRSVATLSMGLMGSRLNLHWRQWLTTHLVEQYLAKRTYYDIAVAEDLDNPDQRIQENVAPFTQVLSYFPLQVLSNFTDMAAGAAILATIDLRILTIVAIYALIQTAVIGLAYIPTIKQNFEITVAEADLRYGILHVRENAETVAFYRGERSERLQILDRLATAVKKQLIAIFYNVKLMAVSEAFGVVWQAMPYLLLVPIFFAGKMPFGAIAQGTFAATQILSALRLFMNFVPQISQAAPQAVRLAEIQERFEAMDAERRDTGIPRIGRRLGPEVRLDHVSLETPGGEQPLVRDLTLRLGHGEHLVIVGQTGVGKSALLRAMAGLWGRGSGAIQMPEPQHCLFLPQRPYMILADLRSQLLYPRGAAVTDDELYAVLARVNLADLGVRHGGLDAVRDWGKVLSLGEQQRIGFARILVSRPDYVFLDEATSAVDLATEARLYDLLAASGASYVSVGHRASILAYHTHGLQLFPGGAWALGDAPRAMDRSAPEIASLV
jgi:putative ATP-binding cassette transporter